MGIVGPSHRELGEVANVQRFAKLAKEHQSAKASVFTLEKTTNHRRDSRTVNIIVPFSFNSDFSVAECIAAETLAAVAECALYQATFSRQGEPEPRSVWQDFAMIILASFASFIFGELLVTIGFF